MEFTVALCTRDRRSRLIDALKSLRCQTCDTSWEVLVIDNGSVDDTSESAAATAADFPVALRVVREETLGLCQARNRALEDARGRVVLFLDDDATCRPGWLGALREAYRVPEVVGTAGRILPVMPPGTPAWILERLPLENGGPTARYDCGDELADVGPDGRLPPPFGANMGMERALALDLGGFRTQFGYGPNQMPSDDFDMFKRIWTRPGRVVYVPDAIVDHHLGIKRMTWRYFLRWEKRYGRSTVLMDPPEDAVDRRRMLRQEAAAWRRAAARCWRERREPKARRFDAARDPPVTTPPRSRAETRLARWRSRRISAGASAPRDHSSSSTRLKW